MRRTVSPCLAPEVEGQVQPQLDPVHLTLHMPGWLSKHLTQQHNIARRSSRQQPPATTHAASDAWAPAPAAAAACLPGIVSSRALPAAGLTLLLLVWVQGLLG
jgi:hypothetical protein